MFVAKISPNLTIEDWKCLSPSHSPNILDLDILEIADLRKATFYGHVVVCIEFKIVS